MLQEKFTKEKDFQKGYKHNVQILRKNKVEAKQMIKVFIKKLHDENEELKGNITWLKSQNEKPQDLRQKVESQETIERKWTLVLFLHKKQQEALDSRVKGLTKEKKEKENVLTYLELMNMRNVSLLQSKKLGINITKAKKEKLLEERKECQKNLQHLQAQLDMEQEQRKSLDLVGVKKKLEDYEQILQFYTLMKMKNKMKDFEA